MGIILCLWLEIDGEGVGGRGQVIRTLEKKWPFIETNYPK